ncbi:MAG: hypothetical protein CH104c_0001 [Candidatus Woesebacteria bacterium]|nr:MAG: hypothetical protein CH104c_0001 [Candidatus Woesebacteria bacterium]
MNKPYYRIDKDGPCHNRIELWPYTYTLAALITLCSPFLLAKDIQGQVITPTPHDVFMSVTFQTVIEGEATPTPTIAPTPTSTPSPSVTPALYPTPIITPTEIPTPPTEKTPFKIFGYAPSSTFVSLIGKNTLELTSANESGYFEFNNVPLPEIKGEVGFYPELCIQAYFQESSTQPTCLAPLPVGNKSYEIGPVVLSPILIIEKGEATTDSQIKAIGKTTPNTELAIFLAKEEQKTNILDIIDKIKLIKTVSAYYLPKYQTVSDANGNFEFNLPTESSSRWRIFAASLFQGQNSPKSNTLSFLVIPQTLELIQKLISFIISLFSRWFFNLILLEIIVALILFRAIRKTKSKI